MAIENKKNISEKIKNPGEDNEINKDKKAEGAGLWTDGEQRPFTKINFYMMGGCIALIIIGFLLMSGGGSDNPAAFNPEIFSTRRIVIGPALAFLGFLLMAFAIIYTPKDKKGKQEN